MLPHVTQLLYSRSSLLLTLSYLHLWYLTSDIFLVRSQKKLWGVIKNPLQNGKQASSYNHTHLICNLSFLSMETHDPSLKLLSSFKASFSSDPTDFIKVETLKTKTSNPISIINVLYNLGQSLKPHLLHVKAAVTYFSVFFKGITSNIFQVCWKQMKQNPYDYKGSVAKKKKKESKINHVLGRRIKAIRNFFLRLIRNLWIGLKTKPFSWYLF